MNKNGRRCGPAAHGRATRRRGLAGVFEANNDVGKVGALIQQAY